MADEGGIKTPTIPMRYCLVLQRPASSVSDYDFMIGIENELSERLRGYGTVDGHDAGSGQSNIFIRTDDPNRALQPIKATLEYFHALANTKIAYRETTGSQYTILWPVGLKEFHVL